MNHPKKIIVGSMMIAIFILIVSMSSWYVWNEMYFGDVCSCAIPLPVLLPLLATTGMLVGTLVYYIFSPKFERKPVDREAVLRMLSGSERKIINELIENKYEISQARIGHITGMTKVSVFRSLEKLRRKGIIEKQKNGKTNTIKLNEQIMRIFE